VRGWITLAAAAAALLTGGCAAPKTANVGMFLARAPLPLPVHRGQELAAAERIAARREGDFVVRGIGASMEPVYVAGTALVVHPTAMHMLRQGQPVVFADARGVNVTHMLLEKTERGWRTIGLNNEDPDDGLVTERNLLGIVKQAFVADDVVFPAEIAGTIAVRRALAVGHPVAELR
jgi:hypothetical protein